MNASHLMNTYSPQPVSFARGEGAWLWATEGRKYLDALAGIAVNGLGHNHPVLVKAIAEQAARIIHTSNLFEVPEQEQAAAKVCALAGMDNAFFANSGAEANECAIKLARLHGHQRGIENATIVVMEKAWHGRTLATLSATGSRKAQAGFEPLMGGFLRVPYNDFAAVERLADNQSIVAVLLEVLQGEGGIHVADADYLRKMRELCDRKQWLLMIDEVQSGIGRTGKWFAHQWAGIVPDVMPLAKGLGSGVPIGACLARGAAAKVFKPGNHGTTFGGGPLVSVAAYTTLEIIEKEGLLAHAEAMGKVIRDGLQREPRLTATAGSGQSHQTRLPEHCTQLGQLALATNEAGQRDGQPTRPSRSPQRRNCAAPDIQLLGVGSTGVHQPLALALGTTTGPRDPLTADLRPA